MDAPKEKPGAAKPEAEPERKKVGTGEFIMGSLFLLTVDGFALLLDITVIGAAVAPLIQSCGSVATTLFFRAKGDKNATKLGKQIIKQLLNLLPILPTLTTVFCVEAYLHNHPEKLKKAGAPAGAASKA